VDVITPPSLQVQQPNQNSISGMPAQTEVQKSIVVKILDFVGESIFEFFLIILFSVLFLTILNYFKLLPLSSIFPFLSFLPHQ
jgi:membrane glycosyltransferase